MKKILSLFMRNYDGNRLVRDEIVPGAEWVIEGHGTAYRKWDGTSCMVHDGVLYKRYDRKKNKKTGKFKDAPSHWEPCEKEPNPHTDHWPGWLPISNGPEDQWHREAFDNHPNGTYELCGPKIQGNPEDMSCHRLVKHDSTPLDTPRKFEDLREFLRDANIEGIVWHSNGKMVKIKTKDFGLSR